MVQSSYSSSGTLEYVTVSDVSIADGYPIESADGQSVEVAVYVTPPAEPVLCVDGGSANLAAPPGKETIVPCSTYHFILC